MKNHPLQDRPIGVFDSGVGGLSILAELQKLLPKENFVFLADQKYVPYGEKTKAQLVSRCLKVSNYLAKTHNIKMLVVACNTATCAAISEMRAKHKFPIVGTVPAVKLAAERSKSATIAVISTPSTSQSIVLKKLIKDHCKKVKVLNIGCKHLEDVVEHGKLEGLEADSLLRKYLSAVVNSNVDELVLGCTHYPFLKKSIRKIVGPKVELIDSGEPIARHTHTLLANHLLENAAKSKEKDLYLTTGDPAMFSKVASILLKKKVKASQLAF